jgi:hypothetical protein
VPGSIAPPKLRTAKCAWVDSTSKTQGIGVGDRPQGVLMLGRDLPTTVDVLYGGLGVGKL